MTEKEIYMLGVRTVLNELDKRTNHTNTYTDGLLAGIEIGLNIDAKYENQYKNKFSPSTNIEDNLNEGEQHEDYEEDDVVEEVKKVPKFHRRHRSYDDADKRKIVREIYENGFDFEGTRIKYGVLGKTTIHRWVELFSVEMGYDLNLFKEYLKNKKTLK